MYASVEFTQLTLYGDIIVAYEAKWLFKPVNLEPMCDVFTEERENKDIRKTETLHYMNVIVLIKFSQKTSVLHKIICFGCVLESPHRGDSNTHPKHIILWRYIENYPFLSF